MHEDNRILFGHMEEVYFIPTKPYALMWPYYAIVTFRYSILTHFTVESQTLRSRRGGNKFPKPS